MLSHIPARLVAGTTVIIRRSFSNYSPAAGWTYKLWIAGAVLLSKDGIASGSEFEITLTAAETAPLTPGSYRYSERVTKTPEVIEVSSGILEVDVNLATATAGDYRTHARKVLDAIEAVIATTATKDQQSYQIQGRALAHYPLADLLKFRQFYREEVRREQAAELVAQGLDDPRRIGIRLQRL